MVGRGWWLLVWTVYAAWTVGVVCGGLSCQQGQEFYNSQQGRCVPCTRCHVPQVVVVPCYVYQDAVCASAAQFLPTWSQPTQPQAPTLSTPTTVENSTNEYRHGQRTSNFSSYNYTPSNNHRKTSGHHQGTDKAPLHKNSYSAKRHSTSHNQNDSEKTKKGHSKHHHHHHHHRHTGEHTEYRAPNKSVLVETKESVVSSITVSQKSDASESVSENSSGSDASESSDGAGNSVSDCESLREDICDGANSNKDEDSELPEPETTDWQTTFFLTAIIVITICVILLFILTVSHLRSAFTRWKLGE